jgi:hypothetical protein
MMFLSTLMWRASAFVHACGDGCEELIEHPVLIREPRATNIIELRQSQTETISLHGRRLAAVLLSSELFGRANESGGSARESNSPNDAERRPTSFEDWAQHQLRTRFRRCN